MALDPSLFVVLTCAQSVAVFIHSFIHSIPVSAENAPVLTESAAPSDLYFTALTINLHTYLFTLQKKQLKNTLFRAKL